MTTDKNLPKPEHGTVQAQDIHEIEKEPETDSAEEQNSFPSALIAVQITRTLIEAILAIPWIHGALVFFFVSWPFGLHFVLQAVAWSRAKKETRIAWVIGTNLYSLLIVSPYGAICATYFIQLASDSAPGLEGQALPWVLIPPASEAVISIVMIVAMSVIKRNSPHDPQDENESATATKPRIYDDALHSSQGRIHEVGDESESLKKHHEDPIVEISWQHVNVRSQKQDQGEQQ